MSLQKLQSVDRIEVLENGIVQVRTITRIMEDGKQLSGTFHRHVIAPGNDYSNEDSRVQTICSATHTVEVIEAYKAAEISAQGV
jgi:hypothetical protein